MPPQTKIDKCTERCDLVDLLNEYRRERVQAPARTRESQESQVPTDAPDVAAPQEHQAKPLGTPVAPSSAGHTLGSAVRDKAPAALTASELRARAAEAASARAAASTKARVVSDASVAAGGSAQCAMATGGDAAWIPAALERLLPPNLKQKAGFVKQVQAALQVRGRCGGHGPQRCCPRVPTHLLSRACM